jgi:hypothetical protein
MALNSASSPNGFVKNWTAPAFKSIDDTIVQWIHLHACRISVSHPIESGMRKGQFF